MVIWSRSYLVKVKMPPQSSEKIFPWFKLLGDVIVTKHTMVKTTDETFPPKAQMQIHNNAIKL